MKKFLDWQVTLGIILITLTAFFYYVHFLIFRDPQHIFLYFVGDIAFVFFEVLLVTLVIHRLLHHREEQSRRERHRMLAGAFFSELGTELLRLMAGLDANLDRLAGRLAPPESWSEQAFLGTRALVTAHAPDFRGEKKESLARISRLLEEQKPFLLDIIRDESLVSREAFTELAWSVYHLAGELKHLAGRPDRPPEDDRHLAADLVRVYGLLLTQWADHLAHLRQRHPRRFCLAIRRSPLRSAGAAAAAGEEAADC